MFSPALRECVQMLNANKFAAYSNILYRRSLSLNVSGNNFVSGIQAMNLNMCFKARRETRQPLHKFNNQTAQRYSRGEMLERCQSAATLENVRKDYRSQMAFSSIVTVKLILTASHSS